MYQKRKIAMMLIIILILNVIFETKLTLNSIAVIDSQEDINMEYQILHNELTEIMNEKSFKDEDKLMLYDVLDSLWNSYDNIESAFSVIGYPNKNEYINENFIEPVKKLQWIDHCTDNNDMYEKYGIGNAAALVSSDIDGNHYMVYIKNQEGILDTIEHELRHIVEEKVLENDDSEIFLVRTLEEGWATLGSLEQFRNNSGHGILNAYEEFETEKENYKIKVRGIFHSGEYAMLSNVFLKLTIIVGYENMLKCEKGEITVKDLIDIIYEKLGTETAQDFLTNLKMSILNYELDYDYSLDGAKYPEGIDVNKIISIENTILDLLKCNISNLNTREDVQKYYNFWHIYKKYYCTKYTEDIYYSIGGGTFGVEIIDHTNELLNTEDIENILIDKAIEYNALPKFSENSQLNRVAIKSIFSFDNTNLYTGPINLFDADYEFIQNGDKNGEILLDGVKINFDIEGNVATEYSIDYVVNSVNKLLSESTKELTGIVITKAPDNVNYIAGQNFDPTGMVIEAIWNTGEEETTNYTIINGDNLTCSQDKVEIQYNANSTIKTQVPITVAHSEVTDEAVAPTCTKTGLTEGQHCSVCNEVIIAQETVPALEHSYENGECTRCGEEEPKVTVSSEEYEIDTSKFYITNIQSETTMENFKKKIDTTQGTEIKVYKDNVVVEDSSFIATGMVIKLKKGEDEATFTLIVSGDVDKDGKVDFWDMLEINEHRLGIKKLEDICQTAGNVDETDNEFGFWDIIKINNYRLGKIRKL